MHSWRQARPVSPQAEHTTGYTLPAHVVGGFAEVVACVGAVGLSVVGACVVVVVVVKTSIVVSVVAVVSVVMSAAAGSAS